ncbi:MAG: hypothetical protein IJV29_04885 [Butyrivibrio sp.]|nr:hypothetical protein [Butyrivibrio sp.]
MLFYHFSFTGIDGKKYEFGYDQCILEADPSSCIGASETDYAQTFNNYYYICDGEKYIYDWLKLNDRRSERTNIMLFSEYRYLASDDFRPSQNISYEKLNAWCP